MKKVFCREPLVRLRVWSPQHFAMNQHCSFNIAFCRGNLVMSSFGVLFCFCLGLEEKHMDKTSFMISNQQMKAKDKLNMRSHIHLHTPSKERPGNIERRYERKNCLFRIDTNCTQSTYFMIDLCAISVYPSAENLNQKFSPKPLQTALNPHIM